MWRVGGRAREPCGSQVPLGRLPASWRGICRRQRSSRMAAGLPAPTAPMQAGWRQTLLDAQRRTASMTSGVRWRLDTDAPAYQPGAQRRT